MRKSVISYGAIFREVCSLPNRKGPCHPLSTRSIASLTNRMGNFFSNPTDLSPSDAVNMIKETISQNCVVIYSKSSCPYCTMAKEAFNSINVNYKTIELDDVDNGREIQQALHQMTGARTVPRVFVNGTCIGGGTETRQLNQQGKLLELVQQCKITANGS
ncbi:glutaredoxin 2 [Hyla sarda]|uniref:glutaredoxin 2 n=1 Tax=Hyla sarda TaxID=327740 RepID=UPI0024C29676|nr:glutaredoxin 2 [Hyla sarda]